MAALSLFSCAAFAEDVIKIGVFEPLTGANAAGGAEELDGIRLAQTLYPTVKVGAKTFKTVLKIVIDPFQGTVMATYAKKNLNAKKAVIIREVSNDYSVGLAKYFTDSFVKLTDRGVHQRRQSLGRERRPVHLLRQ
jgi:ABC-type branched-subunit amino acid transport system substrate-binding protein